MFVPLRLHSVFSRGKGSLTVAEARDWALRKRLPAAALADVGNLYGWGDWKRATAAGGFKAIYGCEIETSAGRRLVLLVKAREGYANLVEAFNRKEIRDASGLIGIYIPGGSGEGRGPDEAAWLADLRERFAPGDLYLGAEFANFERVAGMSAAANPFAGLPVVWANPVKYLTSLERLILLHAIEKKVPYPPERERLAGRTRLFGPDQEALAVRRFGAAGRAALDRTREIAEKCDFAFADVVPPLPVDLFPHSLREVVTGRLAAAGGLSWKARQRARRELEAVETSGFAPYFLVVHDIVEFARGRGILHNLRGSGASSFLAWLLGISHVDPLEFDLYFERFLNRGRPDPPDIDLDFDSRRRDEVLSYVLTTYGEGRTGAAYVCSLKNFGGRSALYETLRAFGVPPEEARGHSKRVPYFAEPDILRRAAPAAGFLEVWKLAAELQDVFHEISLHVGGVILTPAPVERCLPLEMSAKGLRMTHFDKDAVEDLKLIKLDLLSVRGLAAVSETKARVRLNSVPPGDPKTFALLRSVGTVGCFQVESPAMRNLLRRMKPADIHDLTTALALVRPGPTESGMKEALLRRRSGRPAAPDGGPGGASRGVSRVASGEAAAPSPAGDGFLARVLPETGGILLYEEQVMQVAERVAGLPAEEGDLLRRSLKRKGGDPRLREKFFREAAARGYAAEAVEGLWRTMEKFSSYSFNKAHSASYAHMAYQAVYLKAHHPVPYFAAVLNAGGGYYELPVYIEEAKRNGIRILPPDVNRSGREFEVEGDATIRVGFGSIKGLPEKLIARLLEERESEPFASVGDVLARLKPGKAELLALIRAGAFDSLEPRRTRQILRYFQGLDDMTEVADISGAEKRRLLYEALGFLPEGDVLELYEGPRPDLRIRDLDRHAGAAVELVVRVLDVRERGTNGRAKHFYLFEDETGLLEGIGERRCVVVGTPPVCFLRGEIRRGVEGIPKVFNCEFLRGF